jgi:ketosteroid isomerase-like protein
VKVLSNIKTVSSIRDGREDIAYDGGTYSLDLTLPDGTVLKEKGNYSLVWTKQSDGKWKLVLVHIEDVTRLPDIQ